MAEAAVWKLLRDPRLGDLKFRRQMPIGPYVADFCCPALKLIIELDGGAHVLRRDSDARRDEWLTAKAGFTILRLDNEAVMRNPAVVFEACDGMRRVGCSQTGGPNEGAASASLVRGGQWPVG